MPVYRSDGFQVGDATPLSYSPIFHFSLKAKPDENQSWNKCDCNRGYTTLICANEARDLQPGTGNLQTGNAVFDHYPVLR
jgi:hypothetical protein